MRAGCRPRAILQDTPSLFPACVPTPRSHPSLVGQKAKQLEGKGSFLASVCNFLAL